MNADFAPGTAPPNCDVTRPAFSGERAEPARIAWGLDIAQCRARPAMVMERYPVDDLVL